MNRRISLPGPSISPNPNSTPLEIVEWHNQQRRLRHRRLRYLQSVRNGCQLLTVSMQRRLEIKEPSGRLIILKPGRPVNQSITIIP